ncbi:hypothetical protein KCP76_15630 [Salmonella enterica subsp. enterica serovar Weltevreden]|nr:hypothetical protein KCP76_15630 [Salmonella enterica subsp. enterica serovar Weltevreden]
MSGNPRTTLELALTATLKSRAGSQAAYSNHSVRPVSRRAGDRPPPANLIRNCLKKDYPPAGMKTPRLPLLPDQCKLMVAKKAQAPVIIRWLPWQRRGLFYAGDMMRWMQQ